jgi:hypothetical protein
MSTLHPAQRYTLLWLAHAMTLPAGHTGERYYCDIQRQDLFYIFTAIGGLLRKTSYSQLSIHNLPLIIYRLPRRYDSSTQ